MTITVGWQTNGAESFTGPGARMTLTSTFGGTYTSDAQWGILFRPSPGSSNTFWSENRRAVPGGISLFVMAEPNLGAHVFSELTYPADGDNIRLDITLASGGIAVDNGIFTTGIWRSTRTLGQQIVMLYVAGVTLPGIHTIDDVWNSVNRQF